MNSGSLLKVYVYVYLSCALHMTFHFVILNYLVRPNLEDRMSLNKSEQPFDLTN